MGLRVATNIQSLSAQRHLNLTNNAQKRSLEKLASGSRIVRSSDDAAGLAISENLRAQIRSMNQAIRNSNDGISMIQTAEGGMTEISNILIRFRELAIQSASDTIGDTERGFIDKEVQQLADEIDRIAESTEFNGKKLLTGDQPDGVMEIQVGIKNDPKNDRFIFDVNETKSRLQDFDLTGVTLAKKVDAQELLGRVDSAISMLNKNRANLGAMQNRLTSTVNNSRIFVENISAARSQIYDVDMATETAELTMRNILSQVGISVLTQANSNNKKALQLLAT